MSDGYIKSLDGVRAIAILLVMTFHAGITHFGWMGVQLFFVLSGFLITGILWKEKTTATSISFKLKKFWVRRSLRIFPLYWGYLLLLVALYLAFHVPTYYHTYFPYLITYTFNFTRSTAGWIGDPLFTHLWSLCIEEQFYLFFPLIIFFSPARLTRYFIPVIIILAPFIRFVLGEYYKANGLAASVVADSVYWNTLSHLDAFFMGGIIHILSLKKAIKKPQRLFASILLAVTIAGIWNYKHSDSGIFFFNDLGYNNGLTNNYQHVWHYTLLNLLFASFILTIVSPFTQQMFSHVRKALESKWMVSIGRVSYGMYVFHWGIFFYVYERLFTSESLWIKVLLFIPYVLLVYLVAAVSYQFFELRFIKLKDRFFSNNIKKNIPLTEINAVADERFPG